MQNYNTQNMKPAYNSTCQLFNHHHHLCSLFEENDAKRILIRHIRSMGELRTYVANKEKEEQEVETIPTLPPGYRLHLRLVRPPTRQTNSFLPPRA